MITPTFRPARIFRSWVRLFAPLVTTFATSAGAMAANVGNWNLAPWIYTGSTGPNYTLSTTTIESDGPVHVGISGQVTGSKSHSLFGNANGTATNFLQFSVPQASTFTYSLSEAFNFSSAVNFGPPSTQTQFSGTGTDNGLGLRITTKESLYITIYDLVFTLTGGAIFTAFGGDYGGFDSPKGVGTSSVTLEWMGGLPGLPGLATFDEIQISGNVTGFSINHSVRYDNVANRSISDFNLAEWKLNTIPEPTTFFILAPAVAWVVSRRARPGTESIQTKEG